MLVVLRSRPEPRAPISEVMGAATGAVMLPGTTRGPTVAPEHMSGAADLRMAARNGTQLGSSLLVTWVVGLAFTNVVLPRSVEDRGQLGMLGFGEGIASVLLILANLGLDTYIRQEVARRASSAREFMVGMFAVRLVASAVLTTLAVTVLAATGRDGAAIEIVLWFALAIFMMQTAENYAALLQAVGQVGMQAKVSVLTKLLWVAVAIAGLQLGFGVRSVPAALALSELVKAVMLGIPAHRVLQIPLSLSHQRIRNVITLSLPFLATALSVRVMSWADVLTMGFLLPDERGKDATGLYVSALRLSQLALILAPVVTWVVMPLASRARERSAAEFDELIRRSLQVGLTVAIPITALLSLNAGVVMGVMQGQRFEPAGRALSILACMFVFTYVNMLASTFLQIRGEGWVVVRATLATIVIDVTLVLLLVPYAHRNWGEGGAGMGAAIAIVTAELVSAVILLSRLGRVAVDRRLVIAIGSALFAVACLVPVDRMAERAGFRVTRVLIDVAMMAAFVWILRCYDIPRGWVRGQVARRLGGSR